MHSMKFFGKSIALLFLLLIMAPGAAAAERMSVKVEIANVRSGPGNQYELLWQIEKYHPILVLEKKGAWYRFKDFEGDQGWVYGSLLDKTPCVIVRVPHCNLRTGPGTTYDIAFSVDKGVPFRKLQTKGQWTQVQHANGDKGWIFNALLW